MFFLGKMVYQRTPNWALIFKNKFYCYSHYKKLLLLCLFLILLPSVSANGCLLEDDRNSVYVSVFEGSNKGYVNYYKAGEPMDERAKINYSELNIRGNQFIAMDHGFGGDFTFNEAFSFMRPCEDQEEIDSSCDKLSFVPEAEQCG